MQSEDQVYLLINHKVNVVYVLYRHAKNLRHVSPQNRFTLKEFETTTREIGLIIFHNHSRDWINNFPKRCSSPNWTKEKVS